ncbi:proline iminopeptidase [Sphingomonas sp. NFR15]|nr:proline iminopeptidase [Sphingomonas sp. NFR15]
MTTRREFLTYGALAGLGAATCSVPLRAATTPADTGGVQWIRLSNGHRVWTQRLGRGPKKILLLHGGPGLSHDYMQCFADYLPKAGYELYFYDQLGCGRSDKPDDTRLWTLPRYLDEVEQVRAGLGLDHMILAGHSWGGILGIEYALRHPERLRGFVLSDMAASFSDYGRRTRQLRDQLPAPVKARLETLEKAGQQGGDEYSGIIQRELYARYICRLDPWPEPVLRSLGGINPVIYNQMQGPDEFTLTGNLRDWDRWADLPRIRTPTLVMGARYDEMDPQSIRREAQLIPHSSLFISETGSHLAMWDDQKAYFAALLGFLRTLPA